MTEKITRALRWINEHIVAVAVALLTLAVAVISCLVGAFTQKRAGEGVDLNTEKWLREARRKAEQNRQHEREQMDGKIKASEETRQGKHNEADHRYGGEMAGPDSNWINRNFPGNGSKPPRS